MCSLQLEKVIRIENLLRSMKSLLLCFNTIVCTFIQNEFYLVCALLILRLFRMTPGSLLEQSFMCSLWNDDVGLAPKSDCIVHTAHNTLQ